jgi:hypothetical protein
MATGRIGHQVFHVLREHGRGQDAGVHRQLCAEGLKVVQESGLFGERGHRAAGGDQEFHPRVFLFPFY